MAAGRKQKLLYAIITNAALLAAAELAARACAPAGGAAVSPVAFVGNEFGGEFPSAPDADLFWRIPPNAAMPGGEERMNRHGLRGPDFEDRKPSSTKRILCLGDSNTFGIGVLYDETFCHRVARWLGSPGGAPWEVINSGVPGYSAFQMLQFLKLYGSRWAPDAVVLYAGAWNDYTPAVGLQDAAALDRSRENAARARSKLMKSYLLEFATRAIGGGSAALEEKRKRYIELWSTNAKRPDGPRLPQEEFRKTLHRIADEADALGAKFIMIVPPAPAATRARFADGEAYANIVKEVAAARGAPAADARAALSGPESQPREMFVDVIHPGPVGHAVIADLIIKALRDAATPGLPPDAGASVLSPPLELKPLQKSAAHELGDPLHSIDAGEAAGLDAITIALYTPHRIRFSNLHIPPQACVRIEPAIFTREGYTADQLQILLAPTKTVGPVTFKVSAARGAEPPELLFTFNAESNNKNPWSRIWPHRVDLSKYAGGGISLIFEAAGNAKGASWGRPKIYAYR